MYTKFEKITEDLLKVLQMHTTFGSLRREIGAKEFHMEPITSSVPKLYYVLEDAEKDIWSVHAVDSEVAEFLLYKDAGIDPSEGGDEPTPEPDPDFKASVLARDSGNTGGDECVSSVEGSNIIFTGSIDWYPADEGLGRTAGNRVGLMITPDPETLAAYPDVKIEIAGQTYGKEVFEEYPNYEPKNTLYYYPLVTVAGQEFSVKITWDADHIELFHALIDPGCVLKSE